MSFYNEEVDIVKNNQDKDLKDNKLTNLDSITANRIPSLESEVANEKYIDDQLDKNTIDLIKHYKTISKYLLEMILIISPIMINFR